MTRRRTKYRIIQLHHVSYDPEVTVLIFRSEHDVLTKLNRLLKSNPSTEFLKLVAKWLHQIVLEIKKRNIGPYGQEMMVALREQNQAERKKQAKLRVRRSK